MNCKHCGKELEFDQPYPINAGFSNQGFLYNETGTLTLIWSSFDSVYESIFGKKHPWMLSKADRNKLELKLLPSPKGDKWSFKNSLRCKYCLKPISDPITKTIYYYKYNSNIGVKNNEEQLSNYIKK